MSDVKNLVEDLGRAFETFKAEHTQQIDEVKRGTHDALQSLKVDRINADISRLQSAIDEVNAKAAAAQLGGAGNRVKDAEYSAAFQAHIKKGEIQASLNKGADAEGGYLAPIEWDRTITDKLVLVSPMRQIASVQTISTAGFSKLFNLKGTTSGWVGETDARTGTSTAEFGSVTYTTGELYANPAATQQMLDDAQVNLEAWLAGEVEQEFAKQEGEAFVSGDGTNKPRGFLTYGAGATNPHPIGEIEEILSGDDEAVTTEGLIDLVYSLPSAFTGGARFVMNRNTEAKVRKLVDGQGNYIWQPSFQSGVPATLLGYAVTEMPDMPDVAEDALAVAFGDFRRAYLVIDRVGVRVLRDPYSNKPYVSFYTTKRVGGGLLHPEPIKLMKIGAAA
jgi:HK97 family phage major capsid protein